MFLQHFQRNLLNMTQHFVTQFFHGKQKIQQEVSKHTGISVLWLDSICKTLEQNIQKKGSELNEVLTSLDKFLQDLQKIMQYRTSQGREEMVMELILGPSLLVQFGSLHLFKGNYDKAFSVFNNVIQKEPQFSVAAHYKII
jgi:hypothetical protein